MKIALAGLGHLGKIHLKCLKEISEYQIVGIYDIHPEKAKQIADEFNVPYFIDLNDLIDNCEVIDIVTPTLSHYSIALDAIKKHKHVFIEKPVTTTVDEARKLLLMEHEANVKVQVGHVERFNPAFQEAKDYLKNPMFIETHRLAQFNPRGTDVSVVLDLMIHDIDIVLSIVNSNLKNIFASGVAVVSDSPDICNARLEFDNGCVANLTASRISLKNMRKSRFFQKDAYISVDFLEKKLNVVKINSVNANDHDPMAMVLDLGAKGLKEIQVHNPEITPTNAIKEELTSFYYSIKEHRVPEVSLEDGFKALQVAQQILDKLEFSKNIII